MGSFNDFKVILNLLNFVDNSFSSDLDFKSLSVGSHDFLTSSGN